MVKTNNKGFFMAEAIVMIALVTTVMAFVYPNVTKLYENYKNRTLYYDQTEDIYALKAVYPVLTDKIVYAIENKYTNTLIDIDLDESFDNINLKEIYITKYMTDFTSNNDDFDYDFYRYLRRMKKSTYDKSAYRLIGKFEKKDKDDKTFYTYASIKIDDPNPNGSL